jgi:hypothetical protein
VVALVVLVTLISLAIWVAYAIPGQTPARVPAAAAAPTLGSSAAPDEAVVVARVENIDVVLPVARDVTTAIAFHPVDNADTVAFSPVGERLGGGDLGQRLGDIFAGGGGVQYFLMDGSGSESSSSTSGLDIGAIPASPVVSPVDGKITAIRRTRILGRYPDLEVDIGLAGDSSLVLVVSHLAKPKVGVGDVVKGGKTALGVVRGFPASLDQALSQYTSDSGDHVQLAMLRVTPGLAGQ